MTKDSEKTLLVIVPGRDVNVDAVFHILVAETGEHLASHLCSHFGFAYGDLYANRPERIAEWTKRFGEIEVKYIDDINISEDELIKRNHAWHEATKEVVS